MYELIPLLAGCAVGFCVRAWRLGRATAAIGAVALIAGTVAATASGELEISPAFLFWDVGQGIVAGLAVRAVGRRLAAARTDES